VVVGAVGGTSVAVDADVKGAGCVGISLDEGAQADKIRLTNKKAIHIRFIVRAFFQWPGAARIT
jgi:hypothetical protein